MAAGRKKLTHRMPRKAPHLIKLAAQMLARSEELFRATGDLDTFVRDVVSEGLARLVYAAYDTKAIGECIADFDSADYIAEKTSEWFRSRGFAEWFCNGAATLFRTSRRDFFRTKVMHRKKVTILKKEKVG